MNAHPTADASWARLEAWLDGKSPPDSPDPSPAQPVSPPTQPSANETRDDGLVTELAHRMRDAATVSELDDCMRRVGELNALGVVDDRRADSLTKVCRERRMILIEIEEQRRAVDSRRPVTVRVIWSTDWRRKVAENQAEEAGELEDSP